MKLKCVEVYEGLYHQEPFDVAFCPYRISPLGAHIDHQYGKINGLAIDKGIHMAYKPRILHMAHHAILYLQMFHNPFPHIPSTHTLPPYIHPDAGYILNSSASAPDQKRKSQSYTASYSDWSGSTHSCHPSYPDTEDDSF